MKKLDFGQTISLLANIGVIAGIVFLGIEIQQNTEMMRSQTRDSVTEKQLMMTSWVVGSPELAAAIPKSLDELSPSERAMRNFHFAGMFRVWENSHYQYRQGVFEEEEFAPRRNTWRGVMENKDNQERWSQFRESYSPEFRAEIDAMVRSHQTE